MLNHHSDFTLSKYEELLDSFLQCGYTFQSLEQFTNNPEIRTIILRHDVDRDPLQSLRTAEIESSMGITGSYYFRITKGSNNPEIIKKIVSLNHELGYHYEDLTTFEGKTEEAIISFRENLEYFRSFYPVRTICMHGSPLSKWDNRELWKTYSYREFGVIAEPYLDLDFRSILYLTDTGRKWNGEKSSVRDKAGVEYNREIKEQLKNTNDIIMAVKGKKLPDRLMLTIHPQRWTNDSLPWMREYFFQWLKNVIKQMIFVR